MSFEQLIIAWYLLLSIGCATVRRPTSINNLLSSLSLWEYPFHFIISKILYIAFSHYMKYL